MPSPFALESSGLEFRKALSTLKIDIGESIRNARRGFIPDLKALSISINRIPSDYREAAIQAFRDAVIGLDARHDPDEYVTVIFCAVFAFSTYLDAVGYRTLRVLQRTLTSIWPVIANRLFLVLDIRTNGGLKKVNYLPSLRTINMALDVMSRCIISGQTFDFLSNLSLLRSLMSIWVSKGANSYILRELHGILSRGRWTLEQRYSCTIKTVDALEMGIGAAVRLAVSRVTDARRKLASLRKDCQGQDIERSSCALSLNLRILSSFFVVTEHELLVVESVIALLREHGIREIARSLCVITRTLNARLPPPSPSGLAVIEDCIALFDKLMDVALLPGFAVSLFEHDVIITLLGIDKYTPYLTEAGRSCMKRLLRQVFRRKLVLGTVVYGAYLSLRRYATAYSGSNGEGNRPLHKDWKYLMDDYFHQLEAYKRFLAWRKSVLMAKCNNPSCVSGSPMRMRSCAGCGWARYCSPACHNLDWREHNHKKICFATKGMIEESGMHIVDIQFIAFTMFDRLRRIFPLYRLHCEESDRLGFFVTCLGQGLEFEFSRLNVLDLQVQPIPVLAHPSFHEEHSEDPSRLVKVVLGQMPNESPPCGPICTLGMNPPSPDASAPTARVEIAGATDK
ncbi:hypothetical protein SCHPADRAFT_946411 [Schizopora paradoxa]|uniref:MYND-type domain-containing protein n=1 Tax=Schizopora paradoxa TaxID=27342 RepID=A0A0H2RMK6_9AGAM|nr:hypothetical protein SCHPADRAFT_946411 [Schizopora paradoxa]